jgi:hypothetical protein
MNSRSSYAYGHFSPFDLNSSINSVNRQTSSEDSSNQREFIVRKVELVTRLKRLLKYDKNHMSGALISNRTENKASKKPTDSLSRQSQSQMTEIDSLMYQAIQYIKELEKNQIQKCKFFV